MSDEDLILLDKIQETVKNCTKDPVAFLSVQDDLYEDFKNVTKQLYDLSFKIKSMIHPNSKALSELIVEGLDMEQIWQQIEFENNEELSPSRLAEIAKMLNVEESTEEPLNGKESKDFNKSKSSNDKREEENENDEENEDEDDENEDEDDENDEYEESVDDNEKSNEENDEPMMEELHDDNNEGDKIKRNKASSIKKHRRTTEVDDKFFKLDDLNEYLKKEDKKEINIKRDNNSSSDEESIDLFNNYSDLDDERDQDEIEDKKLIKYDDFFDKPESDNEKEQERGSENDSNDYDSANDETEYKTQIEQEKYKREKKKVKFDLANQSDETDSDERSAMKTKVNNDETVKSSLETRQERLKKRITELEEKAIAEKPWQLKGEINALTRPQNSLLEEYVEFDSASRPAPIMTEQTTMKLEDIITGRIKDKTWDDVEKKFKPVDTPMEYKKKLIMNQEKSKESLAQIYESEYVKQREALNLDEKDEQEQEPPEHIEIREKIHDLFTKLDALSNFHYTPKLAKPEIKIVSNLPAISMEEVAPVAITNATLLAPEEIQAKRKGDLIGKSERTKTDMKRDRRKKKLRQHARVLNQSKKVSEQLRLKKSMKNPAVLGKLKGRNIIDMSKESDRTLDKSVKSSATFFAHLQDQAQSLIKQKTSVDIKKKNKNTLSAVRLKL